MIILDHSRSQGKVGLESVYKIADQIAEKYQGAATLGYVAAGETAQLLANPGKTGVPSVEKGTEIMERIGGSSDFERAFQLARGLFPGGSSRHLLLVSDGVETRGSLLNAAKEAAVAGIKIHAIGVTGAIQPDVRVTRLSSSQSRLNEGASLELEATIESSLTGPGRLRLFENGIEVESLDDVFACDALTSRDSGVLVDSQKLPVVHL